MNFLVITNECCRGCKGSRWERVFSFGPMPPANAFLAKEDLEKPEHWFPLDVYFCHDCTLLQLRDVVSPELLFREYVYVSSTSPSFVAHFESFAEGVVRRFGFTPETLAVDIGSNDGILLRPLKALGIRVLGVDPALDIARRATQEGIETLPYFFDRVLAERLVRERGHASLITGTNVFAHVNDLDELLGGVGILLDENGVFIIEVPYLVDFLEKNLFDTVYHEHLSYFALEPLITLFARHEMEVFDAERIPVHGGSLRVLVKKQGGRHAKEHRVDGLLRLEETQDLSAVRTYHYFAARIEQNKEELRKLLGELKASGALIAGYGAPAKGNTLLNYFGIGRELIAYIVDDSPWKQGLWTPGTHIPVVAADELSRMPPDYILVLAWNFADSIIKKLDSFRARGGKCIIPVPAPRVV